MNEEKIRRYVLGMMVIIAVTALMGTDALHAGAKVIKAVSDIRSVTVFPEHANVERVSKHTLEPGLYTLTFSHIPADIVDSSIRVSGKGTAKAKILNVKVEKVYLTESSRENIRELEDRDNKMESELTVLADRMKALDRKEGMLKMLSDKTAEALSNKKNVTPPSLQQWQGMLDFIETTLNGIYEKRREIEKKENALKESRALLGKELARHRKSREKTEKKVLVDLEILKAGDLTAAVSYIIHGVKWLPMYDLRIRTAEKSAGLTCSALVSQGTGEDWKNVGLTFSTAKPMVVKRIPTLSPILMDSMFSRTGEIHGTVTLEDGSVVPGVSVTLDGAMTGRRQAVTDINGRFRFDGLAAGTYDLVYELEGFNTLYQKALRVSDDKITTPHVILEMGAIREQIVVTGKAPVLDRMKASKSTTFDIGGVDTGSGGSGPVKLKKKVISGDAPMKAKPVEFEARRATARVTRHNISLSFSLKHRETVVSNKAAQRATIFMKGVGIELEHVAVPRRSGQTFLKAIVNNNTDTPFLAGRVNIFLDGTFVNTASIDFVNPGDSFEVPVGVDESVHVVREPIREQVKTKGVFKKMEKKHLGYLIKAKNFGKSVVKLRVNDQLPVSGDKKIRVVPVLIRPEVEKREKSKDDGILEWLLTLGPGESREIRVEYDVFHPEGMRIKEEI